MYPSLLLILLAAWHFVSSHFVSGRFVSRIQKFCKIGQKGTFRFESLRFESFRFEQLYRMSPRPPSEFFILKINPSITYFSYISLFCGRMLAFIILITGTYNIEITTDNEVPYFVTTARCGRKSTKGTFPAKRGIQQFIRWLLIIFYRSGYLILKVKY